jgi:acetoin utilization protein AcuC
MLAELADELCGGRWVSTGGGGYAVLDVVPRAWTHLLAIVGGRPMDPATETPQAWRDEIGPSAPLLMSDGADVGFEPFEHNFHPASRVDQAIVATRKAVFPELGIPLF